jgi:hypothetical protein
MRKYTVGQSSELVVEVVCRGFALHSINVEVIQERKCEGCLWTLNRCRIEPKPQQLSITWLSCLTAAPPQLMVEHPNDIHDTDESLICRT